ncbi:TonB-dependent receptor [Sphingobacterium sp. lm-10]|uniref:SusC/RagA family TonB-linked outer membrane protein n=1 Tax=Sphingobacterium sp. lm-10 TaxID=2944904 RepID=UPI002022398F|nr:TonB-dependent receptor [Sphingobacterium sp. lm-10]MCL7987965.1 TonB-dependent receptor [Sphingobacterium sp. lm-10]
MKKQLLSFFVLCAFLIGVANAQNQRLSGTVTSSVDGSPLGGVSISVQGLAVATQSDGSGNYNITVSPGATLQFSYVGYTSINRQVTAGAQRLNVVLEPSEGSLEQVVVTGYGVQSKREFTGASARVSGAAIADRPVQSFAQGLTGQATGVNIVQPNGLLNNPPVIRVRGLSSISLSSFPLIVVDGIPISSGDVSANSVPNNPLADINPADIESIDILKDAASASIYGSRAAAGVLVVTTKRGKQGKARVSYDAWVGVNNAVRLPKMLDAQQFMDFKNAAIDNALVNNPNYTGAPRNTFLPSFDENGNLVDVDWQDVVYRTAVSQNHNVSVSGGSDKTVYYFSAGISDQDGFLEANNFKRRSGRFNIDHQATDWLKLFGNVSYNNTVNNAPNSGSIAGGAFNSSGLGRIAMTQAPNVPIYNADGSYNIEQNAIGRGANLLALQYSNPQVLIDLDRNSSETNRLLANLGTELKLAEGLTFKSTYTWDFRQTENIQFWNPINGDGRSFNGRAYNNHARADNWNWINTLQYITSINDVHNFNFLIGSDVQKTRVTNWGAARENLADDFFDQFQGTFVTNVAAGNAISDLAFEAYLASASYNYKNKYFLSGNFRRDGNSALSPGNQWGNFGGASVGWTLSEEDFFQSSSISEVVNNFRLRGSWGRTGNGNLTSFYTAYNLYSLGLYGASASSLVYSQAGNRELKWETSQQTNIGLDVGFIDNRLNFEANWYRKNVDNMILGVPQAPSKGIPGDANTILLNVGSMYNKGWEFAVNAVPVRTQDFTWSTNLNFSTLKNEVTSLVDDNTPILGYTGDLELSNITQVGHSASQIYGVRTNGVNPENGARIFIDNQGREVQYQHLRGANSYTLVENGQAVSATSVTSATELLGNTIPTWFGGFNNTFAYKSWDMALNFTFSGGNYIYNGSRAGLLDQRIWNNSTEALNAWTPENTSTDIPKAVYSDNVSNGSAFLIDANVEKGDFLRLQTATLGYRLPQSAFGRSGISSVRFYVQANNLFLLTGYTGVDPEISSNGNSNVSSGIERNSIPQGRQFSLGVNVGF